MLTKHFFLKQEWFKRHIGDTLFKGSDRLSLCLLIWEDHAASDTHFGFRNLYFESPIWHTYSVWWFPMVIVGGGRLLKWVIQPNSSVMIFFSFPFWLCLSIHHFCVGSVFLMLFSPAAGCATTGLLPLKGRIGTQWLRSNQPVKHS